MQHARILLFCLLVLGCNHWADGQTAALPQTAAETRVDQIRQVMLDAHNPAVLIVAHRANHQWQPENSVTAIEACEAAGIHMAEIDLQRTSNGHYVLMHDKTINRTTTGKGEIKNMTLEEVQQVHLLFDLRPTTLRIPTYEQVMEAARGHVMLNIDLKGGDIKEVVEITRKAGMMDHCLFKGVWSKTPAEELEWICQQPDIMYAPIIYTPDEAQQVIAHNGGFPVIEITTIGNKDAVVLNEQQISALRAAGMRVWDNSLWNGYPEGMGDWQAIDDPAAVYPAIVSSGIGMIQTDLPDVAVEVLREAGYELPQ